MPRKFTTAEQELISGKLVTEGIDLFTASGYAHVTVDELVERAGISKGAFYLFFDSKLSLYREVVRIISERVDEQVPELIDRERKHPDRIFLSLIELSHDVQQRYALLNSTETALLTGTPQVRISGKTVVNTLKSIGVACDFTPAAVEQLLAAVGRVSFGETETEGERLLNEVLDTGFSAFIRY